MSKNFLCNTKNKVASYDYCINQCKYYFNNECKDRINVGYEKGVEEERKRITDYLADINEVEIRSHDTIDGIVMWLNSWKKALLKEMEADMN